MVCGPTRTMEHVKIEVETTLMQQKLAASQERTAGELPTTIEVMGTSRFSGAAASRLQRIVVRVPIALSKGGKPQKLKAIMTGPEAVKGMAKLLGASFSPPKSIAADAYKGTSSSIRL